MIEAHQWFKNGDHPNDYPWPPDPPLNTPHREGEVVRYYRRADMDGPPCQLCHKHMDAHGWIDTLEGGHIVCPGDWIITGVKGERYPCKPDVFQETYEAME